MANTTRDYFEHMMGHLVPRLKREGKMKQAQAFHRERYEFYMAQPGCKKETARRSAWRDVCAEFPPDKEAQREETKRREREVSQRKRQMVREQREKLQNQQKETLQSVAEAMGKVEVHADTDLPLPVAFAVSNLHLILDPEKPASWLIKPHDAPDPVCWNMLMMAARNKSTFMTIVTKELIAKQKEDERIARQEAKEKEAAERKREEQEQEKESSLSSEAAFQQLNRVLENTDGRHEEDQQA